MTLAEIKAEFFAYYAKNETFSIEDDFDKVFVISLDKELDKSLARAVLEDFVNASLVTNLKKFGHPKDVWILNQPLEQYTQTIELGFTTLATLTKLVNDFCNQTNNKDSLVNPLAISEKDIQSLIVIAHQALGGANE